MAKVSLSIPAPREQIFSVLANGWSYAGWVVGASHIRHVDAQWPARGSLIHHSVGPWPLVIEDVTQVLEVEPPKAITLRARLWPVGAAEIRLELREDVPGITHVTMFERAVAGPSKFLPETVQAMLLKPRNTESLRRLADLAIGRADPAQQT